MKKLINDLIKNPRYFGDKFTGQSKISAADHSYFTKNGNPIKTVYKLIELFGKKYSGNK